MARSKRKKTGPASVARWEKDEEIPLDAQEQFHAQRDRILLEGDDAADDDFEDDDEVFALRGVGDDDSDDDDDDDDEPEPVKASSSSKSKSKSKAKDKKKTKTAQHSDGSEGDSESDEGWGRKKSAYYADDAVDSDDDEANELQEAEVRRAQAKARAALTDDDFGLADLRISDDPLPSGSADPDAVAPAAPPPPDLARQSPETLALAAEWADVAHALQRAERALERTHAADPSALSLGLLHVHHQTLLTYATTLAFYFRLRTAERYRARPALLREHPVLKRLLVLKQALSTLEDLDFAGDSDDDEDDESESDELSTDADLDEDDEDEELDADGDDGWKKLELAELLADSEKYGDVDADDDTTKRKKRRVKPAAPPPLELPKTKSKSKKADAKQVFDLVEPAFVSSKAPKLPTVAEADEFGDPLALQAADAADKKARRHTLRFHAAKIESASARRKGKRAELGGDEDVPYPERRKDRERRQAEELERRRAKLGQGGDDLDGEEPEQEKETRKKRRRDEEEEGMDVDQDGDEDGYYQLVAGARKAAKKMKKEQYDAERAAERVVEDDEGADGPRALTRAILKNKGLTPKRAKSVRNPRVKKRLRYEKAQKRVASQRALFKGGLAGSKGVYEGEHSGINPRVVKSTRLG